MKNRITFKKITNWEYWPSFMFYIPNVPYGCYLAIKAKSPVFFSAANPGIKSSGNGTESKYKTIQLVPEKYRPKSILVTPDLKFQNVLDLVAQQNLTYPIIAKPDIGFRGLLVKKIKNEEELKTYVEGYSINIIIQEFINYKNECGVFYYRKPNTQKGVVSSLTLKKFLSVIGDGKSSVEELVKKDERAKRYLSLFKGIHKEEIYKIPKINENIQLTDIGNHSKGTEFVNGNNFISKELHDTFDNLSASINGWYYGRIDIKYNNFEDLENGKEFKVLEVNGIISEPTHMYDRKDNSYFKALKTIRNHWRQLYEITIINHKENEIPYKKTMRFINELVDLKKYTNTLKKL